MHLVDTHCHIDLYKNPKEIVSQIENNQIHTIAVTNTPSVYFYTKNLTLEKSFVSPSLGFHPELIVKRHHEFPIFLEFLSETRFIGEIGLDNFYKSKEDFQFQMTIFEKVLNNCANYNDKILTVHSRRAEEKVIDMIGEGYPNKIILHWYSGNNTNLKKAIKHGFYFSINFNMLNSENGKKIIKEIPEDKLLTESDGPFTKIEKELNSPIEMLKTIEKLSSFKNRENASVIEQIYKNFIGLLNRN